jgi:hypothetical protein
VGQLKKKMKPTRKMGRLLKIEASTLMMDRSLFDA